MNPARFICFEGLDGAGKSTAAAHFAKALDSRGERATFLARKDPHCNDERLSQRLENLADLIWGYGDIPVEKMGDHHALYNVASWLSSIDLLKVQPTLATGSTVVMDNWFYKFLARMSLKPGLDTNHAANCFAHLTIPNHVVLLDVNPEIAASRKITFTRGETGGFDGYGEPNRNNFIRYQNLVREILLNDADRFGWTVIDTSDRTPKEVVRLCLNELLGKEDDVGTAAS